jgi:hypothetical protein
MSYRAESRKLEVEDAFWFQRFAEKFVSIGENFANMISVEFGIPLANLAMPAFS